MAPRSLRSLCLLLALLLPLEVLSQDLDLADALDGDDETPTAPPKPAAPAGGAGEDLEDLLNLDSTTTTTTKAPPKVVPKVPAGTKAPGKPKPKPAGDDFDLADALDPNNDIGGKDKNKGQGGAFSDSDLIDVSKDDTYKPDKGKGGRSSGDNDQINQYDDNNETTAEVGTIAGIVSAVAMALVGAISSYISYQKKKLCFGIQQSLNTDMVKAENPEAVVATEPQVQQTLLEPPSAEPRTEENAV
ncbi:CD99 antigen-like protein 2 Precursor [Larimichthys crocea]|uniref:CD99 antigen-like protein 2 n=1 Tax=Larimichthys crocea TaxID=215358 RepID=A0A6G0HIC3_LARCR|nr:CD99 antigen-like protein 2 [Larimichthys crocea]KAE8278797.1 CD99 antigen-like protein 2 Precursor [Larimichthys crocea]